MALPFATFLRLRRSLAIPCLHDNNESIYLSGKLSRLNELVCVCGLPEMQAGRGRATLSVESLERIMKPTKNLDAFYYHHGPAVLNIISPGVDCAFYPHP